MLRDTTLPLANRSRHAWIDLILAGLAGEAKGKHGRGMG